MAVRSGHQSIKCVIKLPQSRLKQLAVDIGSGSGGADQSLANLFTLSMQAVPSESVLSSKRYFDQLNCAIVAHDYYLHSNYECECSQYLCWTRLAQLQK